MMVEAATAIAARQIRQACAREQRILLFLLDIAYRTVPETDLNC